MHWSDFLHHIRCLPANNEHRAMTRRKLSRIAAHLLYDANAYRVDLSEVMSLSTLHWQIAEGFVATLNSNPMDIPRYVFSPDFLKDADASCADSWREPSEDPSMTVNLLDHPFFRQVLDHVENATQDRQLMARVALNTLGGPNLSPVNLAEVPRMSCFNYTVLSGFRTWARSNSVEVIPKHQLDDAIMPFRQLVI